MPITWLDLILLLVMLVSGLLAMIRGFMREVLSIGAWGIAAFTTLYTYGRVLPSVQPHFSSNTVATAVTVVGIFLVTLLVVSILTVRISDLVLDSRVGALDRTLGFLFGMGRGLLIVVVAYLFFDWLVPERSQPDWVTEAKSKVVIKSTGDWLKSLLPEDPESTILKRFRRRKPEGQEPADNSGQHSERQLPVIEVQIAKIDGKR
jgi:membrane protein required for colicin V production